MIIVVPLSMNERQHTADNFQEALREAKQSLQEYHRKVRLITVIDTTANHFVAVFRARKK